MMPIIVDKELKEKYPWRKYLDRIVNIQNSNWVQLTIGDTGSGKSSFNLSEAFILDKTFTVCKERIAFNIKDFIQICRSFDEYGNGKGKVVLLEEVGVEASSKDYNKISSREFINVIQTFRSQGLILLMSVPDEDMFLKDGRRLLKGLFITKGIDFRRKTISVKPFKCKREPKEKRTYYYYLRSLSQYGTHVVDNWTLPWVEPEQWERFEKMMNDYKKHVRDRAYGKLSVKRTLPEKRQAKCNNPNCGFSWPPRNLFSEVAPRCPRCLKNNTIWLEKQESEG